MIFVEVLGPKASEHFLHVAWLEIVTAVRAALNAMFIPRY
jgi:hypothetical protein